MALGIKQRFSRYLPGALPRRCFISRAYKDEQAFIALLTHLPDYVSPKPFPAIDVPADQRVSDDLIEAILDCPGLIYIKSEMSSNSFWVTFERDYALRAKRRVYCYDSIDHRLTRDRSRPMPMPVFQSYHRNDREIVKAVSSVMGERYFSVSLEVDSIDPRSNVRFLP
jgi:hypothetical protein